jgi:hypothetical protein
VAVWWVSVVVDLGGEDDDESRVLHLAPPSSLPYLACLIERLKGGVISLSMCREQSRAAGCFACSSVLALRARAQDNA